MREKVAPGGGRRGVGRRTRFWEEEAGGGVRALSGPPHPSRMACSGQEQRLFDVHRVVGVR